VHLFVLFIVTQSWHTELFSIQREINVQAWVKGKLLLCTAFSICYNVWLSASWKEIIALIFPYSERNVQSCLQNSEYITFVCPSTGYSDQSSVQLPATLKRDHDPYYGFSSYDRHVSLSEVSGTTHSLTCFGSLRRAFGWRLGILILYSTITVVLWLPGNVQTS
jgi:hypothetical protein